MNKYSYEIDITSDTAIAKIIRMVPQNSIVLEIGTASGHVSRILKEQKNCSVYGIEIDENAARDAALYTTDIVVGDVEAFDLRDKYSGKQFDVIILADVLEHLKRPDEVLRQCYSLLAEAGEILISIPNIAYSGVILSLIQGKFLPTETGILDKTHLRFFSRAGFTRLLESCGYYVAAVDSTFANYITEEFKLTWREFPPDFLQYLRSVNIDFDSYQLLYKAKKSNVVNKLKDLEVELDDVKYTLEKSLEANDRIQRELNAANIIISQYQQKKSLFGRFIWKLQNWKKHYL